jgi:hypothetical protein
MVSLQPFEGPAPRGSIDVRVALPSRASAVTLVLFACNAIEWNLLLGDSQPASKSDKDGKEVKASKQETKASAAESKAGSAYAVTGPTISRVICIGWVPHTVRINGKRVFDQVVNVTFEPSLPWVLGLLPVDDAELADFANKMELLTGVRDIVAVFRSPVLRLTDIPALCCDHPRVARVASVSTATT